jgi:hypothetical protein
LRAEAEQANKEAEKAFRKAAKLKARLEEAIKKAKDFKPDIDKKELESP